MILNDMYDIYADKTEKKKKMNVNENRFAKRARLMVKRVEEQERAEREDGAARLLQRTWGRHCEWEKMRLRFRLRRKAIMTHFFERPRHKAKQTNQQPNNPLVLAVVSISYSIAFFVCFCIGLEWRTAPLL